MGMRIAHAEVRQVRLPLTTPYKVSLLTMEAFDPFVVVLRDDMGGIGFGEALIVPGYTTESPSASWECCCHLVRSLPGLRLDEARQEAMKFAATQTGAASAVLAALDMLDGEPLLRPVHDVHVPLLAPLHADEPGALREEIDARLAEGFQTLKVKVGFAWRDDLQRVELIQQHVGDRAILRLDANQGYTPQDGCAFAAALTPGGIALFEQPCHLADWEGNARVAAVSTVPVMLDESIYGMEDIARAATMAGVGFVKLKLKKIGSAAMLLTALKRIRELGMVPVLGDGVSLEIGCWMEACVAACAIDNAGEMNGFLKARERLFENPLPFSHGAITVPAHYVPRLNADLLERATLRRHTHSSRSSSAVFSK
jgi:L-alanine-DL-glutamate epimerase-like enolase superfamily enzyme